jgi:heme oxygenase
MNKIININKLRTTNWIGNTHGSYRSIVKCKAGFLVIHENTMAKNVMEVFNCYQKGALQSIEFKPEGMDMWFTVFAIKGKKIICIDKEILRNITVGDINSTYLNTELYSQDQYKAVNAKTWADKAYVMN